MSITLTAEEEAVASAVVSILTDAKTVLSGIASSPITAEAEKLIPGLTGVVAKIGVAGALSGGVAAAIPAIEEIIALYQAGIIKGAEPTDPVFERQGDDPYTNDFGNGDGGGK